MQKWYFFSMQLRTVWNEETPLHIPFGCVHMFVRVKIYHRCTPDDISSVSSASYRPLSSNWSSIGTVIKYGETSQDWSVHGCEGLFLQRDTWLIQHRFRSPCELHSREKKRLVAALARRNLFADCYIGFKLVQLYILGILVLCDDETHKFVWESSVEHTYEYVHAHIRQWREKDAHTLEFQCIMT